MSDERDPLEEELAGFRPQPLSPQLRRRLLRQLAVSPMRRRVCWGIGVAAAGLAAAVLWFVLQPTPQSRIKPDAPELVRETHQDHSPPTLQEYRRAFSQSPEEMEALLDRQSSEALHWQAASSASVKIGAVQNSSLFPSGDVQ
jgi:hypothetical protein